MLLIRSLSIGPLLLALFAALPAARAEAQDVVINELMPHNERWADPEFLDEDGTKQGWIEIRNVGDAPASLLGFSLTDDPGEPRRWRFPDLLLEPGELLRVWLTGKDRADPDEPLHASFSLMTGGDVFLFGPLDVLVDAVEDTPVPVDKSYGRCHGTGEPGYFYRVPTPGADNPHDYTVPFVTLDDHVSLTVGQPYTLQVWPDVAVTWESDNPHVTVSENGVVTADADALSPDGQAIVTAREVGGDYSARVFVTIVSWTANVSTLELVAIPEFEAVLAEDETGVYFARDGVLYRSESGLQAGEPVGTTPAALSPTARMLLTPFGAFIRQGGSIYHSDDFTSWTWSFQTAHTGLQNMFDWYYDEVTGTGYVYAGDYSSDDFSKRHSVYRGTFPATGLPTWEAVMEFPSFAEWQQDPSITDAVRHVHVVAVDPFTGHVWVGTGDVDEHSRLYVSEDHGETFRLLGLGDQSWRTLAIWFTRDFVYWNMDTSEPQSIWRLPRSAWDAAAGWPSLTPELRSGTTAAGARYYVSRSESSDRFPVGVGEEYVEDQPRGLDADHRVRALDGPAREIREQVAELVNGSHWFHLPARTDAGEEVVLVAASPEGARRDRLGRVFGIKEVPNGPAIVQELRAIAAPPGYWRWKYTQLIPLAQDPAGSIYLAGRVSAHSRYQMRLAWHDDADSMPPSTLPSPPAPPEACIPVPEASARAVLFAVAAAFTWIGRRRSRGPQRGA